MTLLTLLRSSGTTTVSATRALAYDIENSVFAARTLAYDIKNTVGATRALSYDVIASAKSDRTLVYTIGDVVETARLRALCGVGA